LKQTLRNVTILLLSLGFAACGGSSGGGSGDSSTSSTIEGSLRSDSLGGFAGITISALGDTAVTDSDGNFTLVADGNAFTGGSVEFIMNGLNIEETVVIDEVIGGAGLTGFVNFSVDDSGNLSGVSTDADGNVLFETSPVFNGARCSQTATFSDGGGNALWKPHSERTGTVVILMPANYRNADVQILNSSGQSVASPIIRDCCEHNGGREHVYLSQTSGALAGLGAPLTVVFSFADGFVDCRTVPDPNQRYD